MGAIRICSEKLSHMVKLSIHSIDGVLLLLLYCNFATPIQAISRALLGSCKPCQQVWTLLLEPLGISRPWRAV